MTDVENQMEALQRKMAAKTREIEALVAERQRLGDPNAMESADYARLQAYVQQLSYNWQEATVRASPPNPDAPLDRLIAEREEIEQQIVELQVR